MHRTKPTSVNFKFMIFLCSVLYSLVISTNYGYSQLDLQNRDNFIITCDFVQYCSNPVVFETFNNGSKMGFENIGYYNDLTKPDITQTRSSLVTENISLIMTPDIPLITQLTGDEKIEISGTFGPIAYLDFHNLTSKPEIKINGQLVEYEPADPDRIGSISIGEDDGFIYYTQEIKVNVSPDKQKILFIYFGLSPDYKQDTPTHIIYTSDRPDQDLIFNYASIEDVFLWNITERISVNKANGTGTFHISN